MVKFFIVSICFVCQLLVAEEVSVKYELTVTDSAHHLAEVEIIFPQVSTKILDIKMPVWRSGRYEILDLSKDIRFFKASDANHVNYPVNKVDKNTWRVYLQNPGDVVVKYQLYANMLSERVRHIDRTHAFLDASGVFMYSPGFRDYPVKVELNVPTQWKSRSGMRSIGPHRFSAPNYDVLVDSPIESGIHEHRSFVVDGITYEIVVWGQGNYDMDQLQKDISRLHSAASTVWSDYPFKRYVYMYHLGDGLRGATEHLNSTIIQANRFDFHSRKKYLRVMAVTAHEYVHTWNVKSYRPTGITPYDYDKENYSYLLWMAEGTTSYYDNLLALRAGIYSVREYLDQLADDISAHIKKPGRKVMSLRESSFDKWMVQNADRNTNASVNIYLEGSLVSWLLDKEIRSVTDNKKSLDDLQEYLYVHYANANNGYSEKNVLTALKDITGVSFESFWDNYVAGTESIDFDELLAFYGLRLQNTAVNKSNQEKSWTGLSIGGKDGLPVLKNVIYDSPGWKAGLTTGDTLVAIDGYMLKIANVKERLESLVAGKSVSIHYAHNGELLQGEITPVKTPFSGFSIMALDKPSKTQKKHFSSWTKHAWKKKFEEN